MSRHYGNLIKRYTDTFGEAFPAFMAPSNIEKAMDIIEECLKTGVPYDPYSDPDVDMDADY